MASSNEFFADRIHGLYAVLDRPDPDLCESLAAHASVLQLRLKPAANAGEGTAAPIAMSDRELWAAAEMARAVTRAAGCLFVVDDRLDVALATGADGVHLGQRDLPVEAARVVVSRWRKEPFLLGVSTHNEAEIAAALDSGADYLGFGPVFPTGTKVQPDPVQGIAGLSLAVEKVQRFESARAKGGARIPVVAIGGISPQTVTDVAETGADAACVIGAINRSADPPSAARDIAAAWSQVSVICRSVGGIDE